MSDAKNRYDTEEVKELFKLCGWHSWPIFLEAVTVACGAAPGGVKRVVELNRLDLQAAWEDDQKRTIQ